MNRAACKDLNVGERVRRPGFERRARELRLALWLLVLVLWLPSVSSAQYVYRHVDEQGTVHFSDVPFEQRSVIARSAPPGLPPAPMPEKPPPEHDRFDEAIARVGRRYRVQPALVKAVVAAESNFDPVAISHKGAQGLMQLMPSTAEILGVDDPMVPEQNLHGGVRYLRAMLDRYGDIHRAVAAYNAGPTAVDRYGGIPPYRETEAYVRRVLNYYRGYHGEFRR